MEKVTVSSKGQIAIPKAIRDALNLSEGAKLTLEVNTLTQPDGPNRWQAIVSYSVDAPAQSGELLLAVTANLSREVTVNPPQIGFSCTGEATQVLTLTDRRRKPLTVVKAPTRTTEKIEASGPPDTSDPRPTETPASR